MAFTMKLPGFLSGTKVSADQTVTATVVMEDIEAGPAQKSAFGLGFLNQYSITKRLQILGGCLLLLVFVIGAVVYLDNRQSTYNTTYVAAAGDMRMLSQRLVKASNLVLQGDLLSFKEVHESLSKFNTDLEQLMNGGVLFDQQVPPSPERVQPQLLALSNAWRATNDYASLLVTQEASLFKFAEMKVAFTVNCLQLIDLSEQLAALKPQMKASASQMSVSAKNMARNSNALRYEDVNGTMEAIFKLRKEMKVFSELFVGLGKGIEGGGDAETKRLLGDIEELFKSVQNANDEIFRNITFLFSAKQAGAFISVDSDAVLQATDSLAQAYQQEISRRAAFGISLAALIFLAVVVLTLMVKVYLDESRHQTELADESRQASEAINRQNQDAILRLMNELGDLADGDLTVSATVSEDITGAIADSINYTVEELRVLVGRINDAASRVTIATEIAQQTSVELLDAAKRQSVEIQDAGHSVLTMASSMTKVSGEAVQSAQVARQSLVAAGKGTQAVQDSIKGMNEIREQIQETSKRIKRLGESSQEIGEIVELISDITEQTNVLALNAAIQAASAGDAGRGFTVVAEEVQRLAERSGEATKQIAAIVKTIQTDTLGAISAMEESTRGVVEGAKLSDAAGQALAEIGDVSQSLAELIENISDATRLQADSATGVAGKMQEILRVTEQTTAGTQKTASAVGELAGLATELKGSVAGFKVG